MSKSTVWNQLKELGYDSKQLNEQYNIKYTQATLQQLEAILGTVQDNLSHKVVEDLVNNNSWKLYVIKLHSSKKKDVRYISPNGMSTGDIDKASRFEFESVNDLIQKYYPTAKPHLVSKDKESYLECYPDADNCEVVLPEQTNLPEVIADVSEVMLEAHQQHTVINADPVILPINDPWNVEDCVEINKVVEEPKSTLGAGTPVTFNLVTGKFECEEPLFPITAANNSNVTVTEASTATETIKEVVEVLPQSVLPLETVFKYRWVWNDLPFSTLSSYEWYVKFKDGYHPVYPINNNEVSDLSTDYHVKVSFQEDKHFYTIPDTKVTATVKEKGIEMNQHVFNFQEQKFPITTLQVSDEKGIATEIVNLQDAYFVELRLKDNKLYVLKSAILGLRIFNANKWKINAAFRSLLNGSNFIHLRSKVEANRDILINLGKVKTIERKPDAIVFHWHGSIIPGVHKLSEWQEVK